MNPGMVENFDNVTCFYYRGGKPGMPDGVSIVEVDPTITSIDDIAFEDWYSLRSIIIPPTIKSIGDEVFNGCKALRITSGSGRENKLRLWTWERAERAANFEVFKGNDWNNEVDDDRREEDPFFDARRVAAAAENIFRG